MKSSVYHLAKLAQEQCDLAAYELHFLERRAAAEALREDPGA